MPRFETEGVRAERLLQEGKEAALAGLAPENRLLWVTARATPEVLEAMDNDDRLTSAHREIIAVNVQNFMGIVDSVDRCHREGTG